MSSKASENKINNNARAGDTDFMGNHKRLPIFSPILLINSLTILYKGL